ncbi:spore germination protein [Sporomusa sp.]|uniref:spore germination protein n=1 Tax=Sporomusa sp. TaxID=2078658 RepID=UPI002B618D30|nr:spore germination protein [Sporomusa sp.]HWR05772.1 spore germination protein [Sporomusa sp.]
MTKNMFAKVWERSKQLIDYTPPTTPDLFVLDETRPYDTAQKCEQPDSLEEVDLSHLTAMVEFAQRLTLYIEKVSAAIDQDSLITRIESFKAELSALEKQWQELSPVIYAYEYGQDPANAGIGTSLEENRQALASIYRLPRNKDLVIRDIAVGECQSAAGLIIYMEGIVDSQKLNRFVLEPLMGTQSQLYDGDTIGQIIKKVIPNGQVRRVNTLKSLQESINTGDTALIIDGIAEAIIIETKGWEHRSVDSPKTEQTVRGSLAAFSENLRTNTGLVRSMLRSSDLITEMVIVGTRGQLNCAIMYIDSIVNISLVDEVRRRLQGIETDYISDSAQLTQFIEDSPTIVFPQTMSTERPDRVASHLTEGRVALILEGNPFAQILPVSFLSFFHSGEDFSLKSGITNLIRTLRLFGALIATVLPSLYLSISYFHPEAMPTELLLAVAGSRENVPFPAWFEILIMDISFELIREAGIRIPGILGPTIGIVGAIILGQAAVTARIVSPIVVVIIAITGLASFTIPEYRMAAAVRIVRFIFYIFTAAIGLVGLAMAWLGLVVLLCQMKSFGVPYMVPLGPKTIAGYDVVIRGQVYNQENRPDELNTKDSRRQPTISRKWKKNPPASGGDKQQ